MTSPYAQHGFRARLDWGPTGAAAVANSASIVAVVDVLSFTTTLTVAVDQGIEVFPYRWRDDTAVAYAERHDAVLAVGRSHVGTVGQVSLSPGTIRRSHGIRRLVLPSPNGSAISQNLASDGATVIGVSLRNLDAAANWTAVRLREDPSVMIAVVAAGERWPNGSLRPAVEDLWGAGAFLTSLVDREPALSSNASSSCFLSSSSSAASSSASSPSAASISSVSSPSASSISSVSSAASSGRSRSSSSFLSPEAGAAVAAYRQAADRLPELLRDCAGGRELVAYGYPEDVAIASEINSSRSVPILKGISFTDAAR